MDDILQQWIEERELAEQAWAALGKLPDARRHEAALDCPEAIRASTQASIAGDLYVELREQGLSHGEIMDARKCMQSRK